MVHSQRQRTPKMNANVWSEFVQQVVPNVKQMIQLELVKYINTGERVKDGIIVVICTQVLSLLCSVMQLLISKLYTIWFEEVATKLAVESLTIEKVVRYKFSHSVFYTEFVTAENILKYMEFHGMEMHVKSDGATTKLKFSTAHANAYRLKSVELLKNAGNNILILGPEGDLSVGRLLVPIKSYKHNNDIEFIVMYDNYVWSNSSTELNNLINDVCCWKMKLNDKKEDPTKDIFIYSISSSSTTSTSTSLSPMLLYEGKLPPHMTFDHIYFDQKQQLLEWIGKFNTQTMYPSGLSLSNKLGILLYGPPGTGKTGCIRAIANHLKRNILLVDIVKNSVSKLNQIMTQYKDTHIFVFDEIDYLLQHAFDPDAPNETHELTNELKQLNEGDPKYKETLEKLKNATTSANKHIGFRGMLQLLDGVCDDSNRLIVATTNNIEAINPLFLRPGRFDLKLNLSYCSLQMFKDILKTKFLEEDIQAEISNIEELVSLNITPLELINKLVESTCVVELLFKLNQCACKSETAVTLVS